MTGIDVGLFQDVVAISFPKPDTPEAFVHAELVRLRTDCADPDTETEPGTQVGRIPNVGTNTTLCLCTDPTFGGGYDCYTLRFSIPLAGDWPDCVIGATSGGRIKQGWPGEPPGWGGTPSPISTPAGLCASPEWYTGVISGFNYIVRMTYCSNCQGGVGAPDDCCG